VRDNVNLVVGAKTDSGRLAARLAGGRVSNWRARRRRKVLAVLKVDVHAVIVHKGRVLFQDGAPRRFFHHRAKKFCRDARLGLGRRRVDLHANVCEGAGAKPVAGVVAVELLQARDELLPGAGLLQAERLAQLLQRAVVPGLVVEHRRVNGEVRLGKIHAALVVFRHGVGGRRRARVSFYLLVCFRRDRKTGEK